MSNSFSVFIIIVVLATLAACQWLMWWAGKRRSVDSSGPAEAGKKHGHVWDGDLEEYNNPLPRWWVGLFVGTLIFGVIYLLLYPGFGNFAGLLGWTQFKQHQAETVAAQTQLEAHLAGVQNLPIEQLAEQPAAMATARNLFAHNCSTCHGSDARGARGFPNLTDGDWIWGGGGEAIQQTIMQGRTGVMPPWGAALGEQGVEEVIAYVRMLSGKSAATDLASKGQERYMTTCVACHGVDGKGNQALGAPNLTDDIWLYGDDDAALRDTIVKGRNGQMPAHAELLGETKGKLLAAYVLGLSKPNLGNQAQ